MQFPFCNSGPNTDTGNIYGNKYNHLLPSESWLCLSLAGIRIVFFQKYLYLIDLWERELGLLGSLKCNVVGEKIEDTRGPLKRDR